MRSEKIPYEGHILFEGYAADQVAGIFKIHDPDMWLLRGYFAKRWLCAWCRKGPGMFHDQGGTGHPLEKFNRGVLGRGGAELPAGPCLVAIELRVGLDHRHVLVFGPE